MGKVEVQTKKTHINYGLPKKTNMADFTCAFVKIKTNWKKDNMFQDGSPMIVVHGVMGPFLVLFHPYKWSSGAPLLINRAFP